jgi:HPt (histidine-containing phosphotransfer) domain-containing protein
VREAFSRQTPELLLAIRDAIARGDSDALAQHVHKLKGSMSYFPGQRGSDVAREMEQAARAGDLTRAASLMPDLEQAVAELQSVLTSSVR